MKRNKMMRLASAMMVTTLMTTSVISGTFAKYTTQDSGSDAARVAKWGVELQVVGDLYGEKYLNKGAGNLATAGAENLSVVSSQTPSANVVAPGTLNTSGFSFALNGTPEVNGKIVTKISYENIYLTAGSYGVMVQVPDGVATAENFASLGTVYKLVSDQYVVATVGDIAGPLYTLEDSVKLDATYYPVEYKMTGTLANYNDDTYSQGFTVDNLKGVVDALIANLGTENSKSTDAGLVSYEFEKAFVANQDLATDVLKMGGQNIQWKWDFCQQTTCPDGDLACGYCKADTILGNLMAGSTEVTVVKETGDATNIFVVPEAAVGTEVKDYNLETSFSIDITVTQVD